MCRCDPGLCKATQTSHPALRRKDWNLSPWGETIGSAESRVQVPKGGEKEIGAIAIRTIAINATMANAHAARIAERGIRFFMGLPSLINSTENLFAVDRNQFPIHQNSASSRMKDCF